MPRPDNLVAHSAHGRVYGRFDFRPTEEEVVEVRDMFPSLVIPTDFTKTADSYQGGSFNRTATPPLFTLNPQTVAFCRQLQIKIPCFSHNLQWTTHDQCPKHIQFPESQSITTTADEHPVVTQEEPVPVVVESEEPVSDNE